VPCPYNIILGRETALPSPNYIILGRETALPSPNYIVQPELILHELETLRGKAALNYGNLVGSTSQIDGVTNNIVV
jgi:hypothetical protein